MIITKEKHHQGLTDRDLSNWITEKARFESARMKEYDNKRAPHHQGPHNSNIGLNYENPIHQK